MDNQEIEEQQIVTPYGKLLVSWQVDEYPKHFRSNLWFIIAGIIGALLIIYAIATANFLFAVIILMGGIIMLISSFKDPEKIDVHITSTGVLLSDSYYEFKELKDFSIVYEPPDVKILYLDFQSALHPIVAIPLEDMDPNFVRETLIPYCLENLERSDELLTDTIRRLYKL